MEEEEQNSKPGAPEGTPESTQPSGDEAMQTLKKVTGVAGVEEKTEDLENRVEALESGKGHGFFRKHIIGKGKYVVGLAAFIAVSYFVSNKLNRTRDIVDEALGKVKSLVTQQDPSYKKADDMSKALDSINEATAKAKREAALDKKRQADLARADRLKKQREAAKRRKARTRKNVNKFIDPLKVKAPKAVPGTDYATFEEKHNNALDMVKEYILSRDGKVRTYVGRDDMAETFYNFVKNEVITPDYMSELEAFIKQDSVLSSEYNNGKNMFATPEFYGYVAIFKKKVTGSKIKDTEELDLWAKVMCKVAVASPKITEENFIETDPMDRKYIDMDFSY